MTVFAWKLPSVLASRPSLPLLPPLTPSASALMLGGLLLAAGAALKADWLSVNASTGLWAVGLGSLVAMSNRSLPRPDGVVCSRVASRRRGLQGASLLAAAVAVVLAMAMPTTGADPAAQPSRTQRCIEQHLVLQQMAVPSTGEAPGRFQAWVACAVGSAATDDDRMMAVALSAAESAGGMSSLQVRYLKAARAHDEQAAREAKALEYAKDRVSRAGDFLLTLHEAALALRTASAKATAAASVAAPPPPAPKLHALLTRLINRRVPPPASPPTAEALALKAAVARAEAAGMDPQEVGLLLSPQATAGTADQVTARAARRLGALSWSRGVPVGSEAWKAEVNAQLRAKYHAMAREAAQPSESLPTLQMALEPYLAVIAAGLDLPAARLEIQGSWLPREVAEDREAFARQVLLPVVRTVAQTTGAGKVRAEQGWIALFALLAVSLAAGLRAQTLMPRRRAA